MKRLLLASLAAIVLLAFYVGWPAYSGHQIRNALEARDVAALSAKIDFESVKESLRPAAQAEAERSMKEQLQKAGGSAGVLGEQIAKKALPRLVDKSLDALVTPENIIRIYAEKGSVKEVVSRIVSDQLSRAGGILGLGAPSSGRDKPAGGGGLSDLLGGLGLGKAAKQDAVAPAPANSPVKTLGAPATAEASDPPKKSLGLSNIKRFGPSGILSMELGIAKDPAAADADVTAEMSFTGTDWKLTGLRPRL